MRAFLRHPRRVGHVIAVFLRDLVAPTLPFRRAHAAPGPVRMRLALEELGGAWIKLGQMLAMRFDVLPAAYCDELFKLLNQVRPFPYAQVSQIIRQELGDLPEVVFASFETESFAAASIGQVHRAVLHSGEAVAVKIQRPRIRESLQADIDLMYALARVIDWTHLFGATRSRTVIDEFARWTADELDYLVEARQAVLLYEHARGEPFERIARVYRDYSTSRRWRAIAPISTGSSPAATTLTGSSAISTGTCSTRSTCTATSTPTSTRPTCSCCRVTRSATSTSGSSASSPTTCASH